MSFLRCVIALCLGATLLSACAWNATTPEAPGAAVAPADAKIVVSVEDDTDKAYLNDLGDPASLYRDIATRLASSLTAGGVPASIFDSPGAHRLVVRLRRIQLENNSSGSHLDLRVRVEYAAELGDWVQPYTNDNSIQRLSPGGVTAPVLRDLLSALVSNELASDDRLLQEVRK